MPPRSTTSGSRANGAQGEGSSGRRSRGEKTELHLLRTSTLLFSERGFHGTGIRDIADSAGVAVSAMYYYAGSKDELLEVVIRRGLERLRNSADESLEGLEGASDRLGTLISVHVALHARNPRTAAVIDHEFWALPGPARKEILAMRDAYEELWESVLRAGVESSEFSDRGKLGRLALLEMCTGVAHWFNPRGDLTIPEICQRFVDMGLGLVGAQRDGEPVTARDLELPDPRRLLPLVDIRTEPPRRRRRS